MQYLFIIEFLQSLFYSNIPAHVSTYSAKQSYKQI